jgi:murein DD-endopeptidase MepM/ murein hydrolase activator NlpD
VLQPDERRGWISHGLVALAISALGLAVAGSVALNTSAETTHGSDRPILHAATAPITRTVPGTVPSAQPSSKPVTGVLKTFQRQAPPVDDTDAQVRAAVVKERAAQRADDLSKTAEEVTRATRTAQGDLRSKNLAAADRAIREKAVRIATERRQRATAARLAAENERKAVQASTETNTSSSTTSSNDGNQADPVNIPASGHGSSPVPGAVVGTPFGATGLWARYHTGLDFRAAEGTRIRAVQAGVVLYAGNSGNWSGNHVAILHAHGITTMSSHMSSIAVQVGQSVRAGQVIGYVGHTGRAFGAHLHFEVYPAGVKYGDIYQAVNPVPWLRAQGVYTH